MKNYVIIIKTRDNGDTYYAPQTKNFRYLLTSNSLYTVTHHAHSAFVPSVRNWVGEKPVREGWHITSITIKEV